MPESFQSILKTRGPQQDNVGSSDGAMGNRREYLGEKIGWQTFFANEYRFWLHWEFEHPLFIARSGTGSCMDDTGDPYIVSYHEDHFTSLSRNNLRPAPPWTHINMFGLGPSSWFEDNMNE